MKKAIAVLLCLCLSVTVCATAAGEYLGEPDIAIFIDDVPYAVNTILKNGTVYVPVRAFCEIMDENALVSWNDIQDTAKVSCPDLDIEMTVGKKYLTANGRYLYIPDGCFIDGASLMAPVRQLSKAFGAEITWKTESQSISITRGNTRIQSGDSYYASDDLYWLSRIIHAESCIEPLDGQIGVGNVVLNRVKSDLYPNTIHDVIFDTLYGVQFTPVSNGAIYNEPTESSVIAAKLVLDGAVTVGDSLFFLNEAIATSKWIVQNCDFVTAIGDHNFYA